MSWPYAELSKMAKDAGGPEKLVELLVESGKASGRLEMLPWLGVAAIAGAGITKLVDHLAAKRKESQAAVEAAKAEIIQGIKEYDASHEAVADEEERNED